jgi:GT2 family glycosyltransferase
LEACLRSLEGLPAVVVDNASADGSADLVAASFPKARLVRNGENRGFGAAVNQALAKVETPFVLLLNSDAELRPGALRTLASRLEAEPALAAVGPKVLGPEGPEVSFGGFPGLLEDFRQRGLVRGASDTARARVARLTEAPFEPAWVSGACLLARVEALREVGGFDEGFFLYCEDVDLCLRLASRGHRVAFDPRAEVAHRRGASGPAFPSARLEYHRSHLRLYQKHLGLPSVLALRGLLLARGLAASLRGDPAGRPLLKVALSRG